MTTNGGTSGVAYLWRDMRWCAAVYLFLAGCASGGGADPRRMPVLPDSPDARVVPLSSATAPPLAATAADVSIRLHDLPDLSIVSSQVWLCRADCGDSILAYQYSSRCPALFCDSLAAREAPWDPEPTQALPATGSGVSRVVTFEGVDLGLWWIVADRLVRRAGLREAKREPLAPIMWGFNATARIVWPVVVEGDTLVDVRFITTPPDARPPGPIMMRRGE